MKKHRCYILFILFIMLSTTTLAQVNEVTLVVNCDGPTKTEATALALRNAIEQAFGTFVSANTEILNDDIVRDEIATVSSGNIKSYKEISSVETNDGYNVTVQAVVSVGKLIEYSISHGSSAEFAGKTFAMQMKLEKLNIENEIEAFHNMIRQLYLLLPNIFDYSIEVGSPEMKSTEECLINVTVSINANDNTRRFYGIIKEYLESLSINESTNVPGKFQIVFDGKNYCTRTKDWLHDLNYLFAYGLVQQLFGFMIEDQDGHKFGTIKKTRKKISGLDDYYGYGYATFIYEHYDHPNHPYDISFGGLVDEKWHTEMIRGGDGPRIIFPKEWYCSHGELLFNGYNYNPHPIIICHGKINEILLFLSPNTNQTLYQIPIRLRIPYAKMEELEELVVNPVPYEQVVRPPMRCYYSEYNKCHYYDELNQKTIDYLLKNNSYFKNYREQLEDYRELHGIVARGYKLVHFDALYDLCIKADGTLELEQYGIDLSEMDKEKYYSDGVHISDYPNDDIVISNTTLEDYKRVLVSCLKETIKQIKVIPYEIDGKPVQVTMKNCQITF